MQPTYLPWIGYFSLMDQVDTFVFLDSVQFDKRSWQQRNRIKTSQGELFLTVPVVTKGRQSQKIFEVEIDTTQRFSDKHLKTIKNNYAKTLFFSEYWEEISELFHRDCHFLADLNIALIEWFRTKLDIEVEFVKSSSLKIEGKKVELLIAICQEVGAESYLSPLGSKDYIKENNLFRDSGITHLYQNYSHPHYQQLYGNFIPYMSILDLLFNEGDSSLKLIRGWAGILNK